MEWLAMISGVLVVQAVLVLVYLTAAKTSLIKRSELVGSGLAVLMLAMWMGVLGIYSVD